MDPTDSLIHVIACGVLSTDLRQVIDRRGIPVSIEYLPGGLHARPDELKKRLQERIDHVSASFRGERIVVGYGVCGLGTVGLHARHVPLAIPRVNDCIALLLGSDEAYRQQFAQFPGTYYVSAGWIEEKAQPQGNQEAPIQCGPDCFTRRQLVERYGEENAAAIRAFLSSWQKNYQRSAYIDTGVSGARQNYARLAQAMASEFGWKYEELRGSHDLLHKLLTVQDSTDEILIVPPHHFTVHDPIGRTLSAVPVWDNERSTGRDHTLVFERDAATDPREAHAVARMGLGIDAGGTYTDAVLYDFQRDQVRSVTAALNASIVPYLDTFLQDADDILRRRGITAPRVVVKSDGTLMSLLFARRQPIATILSGPAASVAGASYLARLEDAMVVDMGGTTTDTATIRRGCVRACREGAVVGSWRTHVEALDSLLETQAVIPPDADVANAIGAITARVLIHRQVEIEPTEKGHYRVSGLPNAPTFAGFEEAHCHAVDQLLPLVRRQAKEAGTSSTRVEVLVHDRVAPSGYGGQVFIGRILTARLTGRPDVARLMETESGQLMT